MNDLHILIVEDDDIFLSALCEILGKAGYRTSAAENGKTALTVIEQSRKQGNPVGLIVTDIRMPEMNGLEFIGIVRKTGLTLPIIAMTDTDDNKILKQLISLGCDDFLDKPFLSDQLYAKIENVLEKQIRIGKKHEDVSEELSSYKQNLERLCEETNLAVLTYEDMIRLKKEGYRVSHAYRSRTLHTLGGDYLDICDTKTGCDILVADVAGHDLSASYHTILLKAFFQENRRAGGDGLSLFRFVNEALLEMPHHDRMITAVFLRLNLENMRGEAISAGHPAMIRIGKKSRSPEIVRTDGKVLGLCPEVSFDKTEFGLSPGDRFVLYTDGVINAFHHHPETGKKRRLTEAGLIRLLEHHAALPIDAMVGNVWADIRKFCKYTKSDDMLLAAVEIPGGDEPC